MSRIVPFLDTGAVVTTSRVDVDYVVTEYGVACLRGRSIRERVQEPPLLLVVMFAADEIEKCTEYPRFSCRNDADDGR